MATPPEAKPPATTGPDTPTVLLLSNDESQSKQLSDLLSKQPTGPRHFTVLRPASIDAGLVQIAAEDGHVAIVDLDAADAGDGLSGLQLIHRCQQVAPGTPVLGLTTDPCEQRALAAVSAGAQDCLVRAVLTPDLLTRALHYAKERHRVERDLRDSRERFRLAIAGANDGIWDWDIAGGELFLSDRWCQMLGFGGQEVGTDVEDWLSLVHPDDVDDLVAAIDDHLLGDSAHLEVEHRILHRDGLWRWVRTRGLAVRLPDGRPTRMAGSQTDITLQRQAAAHLLHQARHDALTDLPNRTVFTDRLQAAVERSRQLGAGGVAVLFMDLDRFKVVNDSMGHHVGDRLLVAVAERLRECVRPGDTIARLSGDEFALLINEGSGDNAVSQAPSEIASEIAGRIQQAVSLPIDIGDQQVYTSVSIGIAHLGQTASSAETLLRHADIAMYRAKRAGRACSETYDDATHAWASGRLALENGLRQAIERDELVVHYQPIVRLGDASLVGFEALVRWQHPARGLVMPDEFIPIAEETGLINSLGRWVLRSACQQVATLNAAVPQGRAVSIGVNVSSRQFGRDGFADLVEDTLDRTGLPPSRLVLELTETALMQRPSQAALTLSRLRSQGIRIHLDDFGAGYSSLGYLRRFPIDRLKIDRAFVQGVTTRREDDAIIRAILGLADALGLEVIAEGVETAEQWSHLHGLHCAYGQGFYFSRAVPLDAAEILTRRGLTLGALPPAAGEH